jgi:hypothetical protein
MYGDLERNQNQCTETLFLVYPVFQLVVIHDSTCSAACPIQDQVILGKEDHPCTLLSTGFLSVEI